MRGRNILRWLALAALCFFLVSAPVIASPDVNGTADQGKIHMGNYPTTSWALGVVVPEGAGIQGGGVLKWETVRNLTSVATLPHIANPDGIVYAIMSVMASDGTVLQVAAGAYPNSSIWLAYSWMVEGIQSSAPTYIWILNSSGPALTSGDKVSLSIYVNSSQWSLQVRDVGSGASTRRSFAAGIATSIKPGDQEVFALESYSKSVTDFAQMGNLTLNAIIVDGRKVVSGFYSYGAWDPAHNPLFVVGSSGASPPGFITFEWGPEGSADWGYSSFWGDGTGSANGYMGIIAGVLIVGSIAAVGMAAWLTRTPSHRQSRDQAGPKTGS